jgi:hypothetical protein
LVVWVASIIWVQRSARFLLNPSLVTEAATWLDYIEVADIIMNYSAAGIPLETMWTDIGE